MKKAWVIIIEILAVLIILALIYFIGKPKLFPSPPIIIERSLPSQANLNQEIQINLSITDTGAQVLGIQETIPEGFIINSVSDNGIIKGNNIEWILVKDPFLLQYFSALENKTIYYTIIANSSGTFNISGLFIQDNETEQDIGSSNIIISPISECSQGLIKCSDGICKTSCGGSGGRGSGGGGGGDGGILPINQTNIVQNQTTTQTPQNQSQTNKIAQQTGNQETPQPSSNYTFYIILGIVLVAIILLIIILIIRSKKRR